MQLLAGDFRRRRGVLAEGVTIGATKRPSRRERKQRVGGRHSDRPVRSYVAVAVGGRVGQVAGNTKRVGCKR